LDYGNNYISILIIKNMECIFKKGFAIYSQNVNGMMIVAPHSGPALESVASRDDNSETVASLLLKKIGGKLVISNVSRIRHLGVDFNRDIPNLVIAMKMYDSFMENKDKEKNHMYVR